MNREPDTGASAGRDVVTGIWTIVGGRPLTSVLICEDRPTAREAISKVLRPLPGLNDMRCVAEGFALVDAFAARPVDLVLIGIHCASTTGADATDLLLSLHPTAVAIVFGSDTELLASAYLRGARGILLCDADHPPSGGLIR